MATITAYPNSDLTGDWQLDTPLTVDTDTYFEPLIIATASGAYTSEDSAADALQLDAMTLPELTVTGTGDTPVVAEVKVSSNPSVGTTTHNFDLPATVTNGERLLLSVNIGHSSAAPSGGTLNGWTQVGDESGHTYHRWYAYEIEVSTDTLATALSGGQVTFTTSTGNVSSGFVARITGAASGGEGVAWNVSASSTPAYATTSDPPALNPAWGPENTLFLTIATAQGGVEISSQPSGWTLEGGSTVAADADYITQLASLDSSNTSEDPGVWTNASSTWSNAITFAYLGESSGLALLLATAVTDDVETTELSSGCALGGRNEVQAMQSNETAGSVTLTFGGDTTASIAYNATAGTIETELEALSSIGSGQVSVTGGPLNESPVLVEFTGTLAETDVALITTGDDILISESQKGYAEQAFSLVDSFNIPRSGDSYEPQIHVWELIEPTYVAGQPVDITVASHDNNHSWAAALAICHQTDLTTPFTAGTGQSGDSTVAMYGSVTPAAAGAKVMAIAAKAKAGTYYTGSTPTPSTPAGYASTAEALADGCTLDLFTSAPLPAAAQTPPSSSWAGAEDWATGVIAISPAAAAGGGTDIYAVLDSEDEDDYLEIAGVAGSMYEVVELDLSGVPASGVITSARVEIAHASTVRNRIRAVLVGIDATDNIHPGAEQSAGFVPEPLGETQQAATGYWSELADGTILSDYSRLGIALISGSRQPNLTTHKIYWARGSIEYLEGGPVVSNVAGPTSDGDPITWNYSSASGLSQTHYQIMVISGSAQDPTTATPGSSPLAVDPGDVILDTGRTPGPLTRSVTLTDRPLGRGTCTVAVRAWARIPSGDLVASDWDTADFDISGTPPLGGTQSTQPSFDETDGGVDVELSTPAGISRAWLLRSNDSGSTWELTAGSPYTVAASSTETVTDYRAPLISTTLRYQVAFDAGAMTETSSPVTVGSGDISTLVTDRVAGWYWIVPADPTLSTKIEVADVQITNPRRTIVSEQPGAAVLASSGALSTRIGLQIRTRDRAERLRVEAVIASDETIRLVDVFGREWWVRVDRGDTDDIQRWMPLNSEITGLRDAHLIQVNLVQVTEPT